MATMTATTAPTKRRYMRLLATLPPNSRPRPPEMGPMTDATTFPHAVAMSSHASSCRSEEHTSELQSRLHLVCRLLLEKKNNQHTHGSPDKQHRAPRKNRARCR